MGGTKSEAWWMLYETRRDLVPGMLPDRRPSSTIHLGGHPIWRNKQLWLFEEDIVLPYGHESFDAFHKNIQNCRVPCVCLRFELVMRVNVLSFHISVVK